jgi:cytochrome c-type biogenesis protein CcmH/NrfG
MNDWQAVHRIRASVRCRCLALAVLAGGVLAMSAVSAQTSMTLSDRLIEVLVTTIGDEARQAPLQALLAEAEKALEHDAANPERWYDLGRTRFWYADTLSLVAALKQMKQARDEIEKGMSLHPEQGADHAMAFLGYLYAGVPPWPMGFRDRKKAEQLMLEALERQPRSIANNYLYAYYLAATGEEEKARSYLVIGQGLLGEHPAPGLRERHYGQGIDALLAKLDEQ